MNARLEHVNMHVKDVNQMLRFITTAFPDSIVRYDSGQDDPERWVHVGDKETYLAIYKATKDEREKPEPYSGRPGINHLGYIVNDAEALRQRLLKAGFKETTLENKHPARKRVYFDDPDGNDWEFVEYLTEDFELRNDYLREV